MVAYAGKRISLIFPRIYLPFLPPCLIRLPEVEPGLLSQELLIFITRKDNGYWLTAPRDLHRLIPFFYFADKSRKLVAGFSYRIDCRHGFTSKIAIYMAMNITCTTIKRKHFFDIHRKLHYIPHYLKLDSCRARALLCVTKTELSLN